METNKRDVSARIQFCADKMLPKMRKCLEKKDTNQCKVYPAIELETGVMVATTGYVLAAHKLKDYHFDPSDGAMLGDMVLLPLEVLKMKGTITVEVVIEKNGFPVVTATDENGTTGKVCELANYPKWRTAFPKTTGVPVNVDYKAWDAALKEIIQKLDSEVYSVRLYGEQNSKTLSINWETYDGEEKGFKEVNVGEMPYKVHVSLNGKRLRNMMAFGPTSMRFVEYSRAVMFYNDDTMLLMMPLIGEDNVICSVEEQYREPFDLKKWIGEREPIVLVDSREPETPTHEQTLAERLRAVLLAAA